MKYAVLASHAGSNSTGDMPVICRVASKTVAEQIAKKLRKEKFKVVDLELTSKRKMIKRYSSVVIQEVE